MPSILRSYYSIFFLIFFIGSYTAQSLMFHVYVEEEKCFREELARDVVVLGEFHVGNSFNTIHHIRVNDASGKEVWKKDVNAEGTFAFTTDSAGEISVCFYERPKPDLNVHPDTKREITFTLKTGVDAKDYSAVAKKDDLKPIELEMLKLEDLLEQINVDMKYLRTREDHHRSTNESTNDRVLWLSISSMIILLTLGIFQIFYLKRYFQQKKLI